MKKFKNNFVPSIFFISVLSFVLFAFLIPKAEAELVQTNIYSSTRSSIGPAGNRDSRYCPSTAPVGIGGAGFPYLTTMNCGDLASPAEVTLYGGVSWVDHGSSGGVLFCDEDKVAVGAEWAKDGQMDYMYCQSISGITIDKGDITEISGGNCPWGTVLFGAKNHSSKNDAWSTLLCAKTSKEVSSAPPPPPPPASCSIDSFTCSSSATLSWSTSNCSSRSISPDVGSVGAIGNAIGEAGKTYSLTADGNTSSVYCQVYNPVCSPISQSVNAGQPFSMTASSGSGGGYVWKYGGNTIGTGPSLSHNFPIPGNYAIDLSDSAGRTASCNVTVNSTAGPSASISSSLSTCAGSCSPRLSWNSANIANPPNVVRIYKDGFKIWDQTANASGAETDWNLGVGIYRYCIRGVNADWTETPNLACVTVTVNAPTSSGTMSVSLTANPLSMTLPANSTNLSWSTTGSPDSCTASKGSAGTVGSWSGSKNVAGGSQSIAGLTAGSHIYTITCSKAGIANVSSTVTVSVVQPIAVSAQSVSLSADPASMTLPANSTTLRWSTTGNPDSCTAGGSWSGFKSVAGGSQSITGLTAGSRTYTINCSWGGTVKSSTVTVNVAPGSGGSGVIIYLTADPASMVLPTNSTTIKWATAGDPTSCTASGSWSGSKAFLSNTTHSELKTGLIEGTYTYMLTCSNSTSSKSESVTVRVYPSSGSGPVNLVAYGTGPNYTPPNQARTFSTAIANTGSSSTGFGFYNFHQLASGPSGTGSIIDLPASYMSALPAGEAALTSVSHTFSSEGTYSMRACADKRNSSNAGVIAETSEADNCSNWANVSVSACVAAPVTGLSPSGITNGSTANLSWNDISEASHYNVLVTDNTDGALRYDDTRYTTCASSPNYYCENLIPRGSICTGGKCTVTNVPVAGDHSYTIQVVAWWPVCGFSTSGTSNFSVTPTTSHCDSNWKPLPTDSRSTPSQPVGVYVPSYLNVQLYLEDSVNLLIRGMDDYVYYRVCHFNGTDECTWNASWQSPPGGQKTYVSPHTYIGDAYAIVAKDEDKVTNRATISWGNDFLWNGGWEPWHTVSTGIIGYGIPFRFTDKIGRTWQVRNNNGAVEYMCGGTECVKLVFDSSKSDFAPKITDPGDTVNVTCDYMSTVWNSTEVSTIPSGGLTGCSLRGFDGSQTQASFSCTAGTTPGTYQVACNTAAGTSDNVCAQTNVLPGNLTIGYSAATVDISASPLSVPYNTPSTLSWSYDNASSCTIDPPPLIGGYPSGSGSVSTGNLTNPRTYTISCNPGNVFKSVTVEVEDAPEVQLNVIKTGQGTVTSSPAGINCGTGCSNQSASFSAGQTVNLTATPASGRRFTGWNGACTGTGGCTVTIDAAKTVYANFAIDPTYTEF